jgi:UDPglucose 6-dehydrogenase
MSNVAVIGLGYVGLTTAAGLAKLGHRVFGYDIDPKRVALLALGSSPIYEEGLEEELKLAIKKGSIRFSSDKSELAEIGAELFFVCVATPQNELGAADLAIVHSVTREISSLANTDAVLVIKSTVPVGTGAKLLETMDRDDLHIASNPEFLREGTALRDFMEPDRIVVGASSPEAAERVLELYSLIDSPKVSTSLESAELIKYASNAYLAMRLTFANDLAELSEKSKAKVDDVLLGMGLDSRIGTSFLKPGPGWGGSCFPKDTRALISLAHEIGVALPIVSATVASNELAFQRAVAVISDLAGGSLRDKTVAVWGIAFKANTDDVRDSPAVQIMRLLVKQGATVVAYDPFAQAPSEAGIFQKATALEVVNGADVLAVLTEWSEFASVDPAEVLGVMRSPAVFDARRILPESWRATFSSLRVLGEAAG